MGGNGDGVFEAGVITRHRVGGWVPGDQRALEAWLDGLTKKAELVEPTDWHPVIDEFRELIDTDPIVRMYMEQMVARAPRSGTYGQRHLTSIEQMLVLLNAVLTQGPEYDETDLVGAPMDAILSLAVCTPAGFAAFRLEQVNAMLKKILDVWCEFLSGPESLYVLNDGPRGWKCPAAANAISIEQYEHDPDDVHWGFTSWNDFFTRRFKEGQRPVADPHDDKVIVNVCESTPFAIATDVKKQDRFWIKSQPYSVRDMLANDESVDEFVGGTVYQAFLSALEYHRWHSPVSGTIRKAFVQPGTYFSGADVVGEDPAMPNNSQGYIAHVATRALFFIEADDPGIGLMCVSAIGMAEISSCVIGSDITPGTHVEKGQEIGYFQYGGSTYCLIFRPGVIRDFAISAIPQPNSAHPPLVKVNARLATANELTFQTARPPRMHPHHAT